MRRCDDERGCNNGRERDNERESVMMRESVIMRECDNEGCVIVLAAEEERRVQERAAGCLERAPG